MHITQDTTAEFSAEPGRSYVFSASGDLGGGTVTVEWGDGGQWVAFPNGRIDGEGTRVVLSPAHGLRFVVAGTVRPDFQANILPAGPMRPEGDSTVPRLFQVEDAAARLALTAEDVKWGDIVAEVGSRQVTRIQCLADIGGSLNNTYFFTYDHTGQTYVWFNVDGAGSDPGNGDQGVEVGLNSNASAEEVASAVAAGIAALSDYSEAAAVGDLVTIIDARRSSRWDAYDDGGTGFAIEVAQRGVDPGGFFFVVDPLQLGEEAGWRELPGVASLLDVQDSAQARRAVVPATLTSWWDCTKTLAQTVFGSWTWLSDQIFSGTNNLMPNQAALSSGASLVNRALLTDELIWSAPRYQHFELASAALLNSANASALLAPGEIALSLTTSAVNGNYAVATLLKELGCAEAGGGTPNFNTRFFIYVRLAGGVAGNVNFRFLVGVTTGKTGTLDDRGIGFRMTSDTTAVLIVHNGTTLTESASFTVANYGSHRHFLLENVGNGTVRVFVADSATGARFSNTPAASLAAGPVGGIGMASGKFCVVAQLLANGTPSQASGLRVLGGSVYWP